MLKLNLEGDLRKTTMVFQLVDISIIAPKGVIEDVMASIESWEYLIDILVLQPKTKFKRHPLILGRYCLVTAYAYISCRDGNMTIKNGHLKKQLVLYPHSQPFVEHDILFWVEEEEEEEFY